MRRARRTGGDDLDEVRKLDIEPLRNTATGRKTADRDAGLDLVAGRASWLRSRTGACSIAREGSRIWSETPASSDQDRLIGAMLGRSGG